jgi:hypothetical protein
MGHKNQRKRGMIKILAEEMIEGVMIAETTDETAWRDETIEEMTDEVTVIDQLTEEMIAEEMTDAITVIDQLTEEMIETEETILAEEMTEEIHVTDQLTEEMIVTETTEETIAIEMTGEIPIGVTSIEGMIEDRRERMKEETTEGQMIEGNRVRRALQEMTLKEENLQVLVQVVRKTMEKVRPKSGQRRSVD